MIMTSSTDFDISTAEHIEQVPECKPEITAEHIQELIDTNQALRESVITIATLLKEQLNNAPYPQRVDNGARNDPWLRNGDAQNGPVQQATSGGRSDRESRKIRYEEQWKEVVPMSPDDIDKERMKRREEYESALGPL